jgi:UbiA prenyltransferase family
MWETAGFKIFFLRFNMGLWKSSRINIWWNHMILPLTFWFYLLIFMNGMKNWGQDLAFLFIGSVSIAFLGFLINDYFDRELDGKAGKTNFFDHKNKSRYWLFSVVVLVGFISWSQLNLNTSTVILLAVEVLLFLLYSSPPFRIKNKLWGLFFDSVYSRVIPIMVILSLTQIWKEDFILPFGFLAFTIGLRNIINHQIDDQKSDLSVGNETMVVRWGKERSIKLIFRVLLPTEILLIAYSFFLLSQLFPGIDWIPICFGIFSIIRFRIWLPGEASKTEWKDRGRFFLNDLYADFMPVGLIILYTIQHPDAWYMILIQFALFPSLIAKYLKIGRTFFSWLLAGLLSIIVTAWYKIINLLRYWVNQIIIRSFRSFGVDLEKENLSAIGYFRKKINS